MGLGSLFKRRQLAAPPVVVTSSPEPEEPPTQEQLAELQDAWSELAEAARGSGVNSFHACSRNSKPWQEDPAAVRSMAALLRRIGEENAAPDDQPAG